MSGARPRRCAGGLALLLAAGCAHVEVPAATAADPGWVVAVYLAADYPDLEPHALADLLELQRIDPAVRVEVLADLSTRPGEFRFRAAEGLPAAPTGPEPSGPPAARLARLLAEVEAEAPAARRALVLWGHGQGWRSRGPWQVDLSAGTFPGGVALDASDGAVLDIPTLADVLRAHPVELVVGDACLVETLEIAAEVTGGARYWVGSEQIAAYEGLRYQGLAAALTGGSTAARGRCGDDHGCSAAVAVAALGPRGPSAVSAAVEVAAVDGALDALAEVLRAASRALEEDPLLSIDQAMLLSPRGVPHVLGGSRDVGHYLAAVEALAAARGVPSLAEAAAAARRAVGHAVVARYLGANYPEATAGVSVWLPFDAADWDRRWPDYRGSRAHARLGTEAWARRALAR